MMRRPRTGPRRLTSLVAAAMLLSACSFSGLSFVQDRRLDFTVPGERELVSLPTTIEWQIEDFDVVPPGSDSGDGYFGVFVDTRPQPPGQPLSWFATDDDECQRQDDCPDTEYYADRDIYTTTDPSHMIEFLSQPSGDGREFHEVTVVLLDADSRRIGESAWTIQFELDRQEG